MRILASIVTYNRIELLKKCIEGIQKQILNEEITLEICVINNSSTDGTDLWLKKNNINTITQANEGGSAGFHRAMLEFTKSDFDFIWLMDDDGLPEKTALQNLINYIHFQPAVLNSTIVNINNPAELVWRLENNSFYSQIKDDYIKGIGHFFNGTLIPITIIKEVGLPNKNLVIWGDETEYFARIKKKFPIFTITKSLHFHPKANFSVFKNLDLNFKLYYYFRNKYFIFRTIYNSTLKSSIKYSIFCIQIFFLIIILNNEKLKKIHLLIIAVKDIITNNFRRLEESKKLINEI